MRSFPDKQTTIIYANFADFYADKILCSSECTPGCSIWPSSRMLHQWIYDIRGYNDRRNFVVNLGPFIPIGEFVPLVGGERMGLSLH